MLKKRVCIYISQKSGMQRDGWQQGEVQQENHRLWQVSLVAVNKGVLNQTWYHQHCWFVSQLSASDSIQHAAAEASRHKDGAGQEEIQSLCAPHEINWVCFLLPWGCGGLQSASYHAVPAGFELLCVHGPPGPFTKISQSSLCVCHCPHQIPWANTPVPLLRPSMQIENDQSKLQPSPWKRLTSLTITGPY